jgi:transcriptional regulator with XRE-family HTH domain
VNFFGNNLRVLRIRNGHTQEDMEKLLGIGKNTWSHYENSKSEPSMACLIQISNFFGVTLDELIVKRLGDNEVQVKKKPRPYPTNDKSGKVKESGFEYLKKKVEKLEKEFDSMKKSQSGKKSG